MKVALYLRYSSDSQTEQSIEGQQRVCTAFCTQNNFEIVKIYADRALSASKDTEKRLQFQQMVRDSEKRLFEAVVVYKLDRFARNRYDSATYKAKLSKNGVRLISATENISDTPEGALLESVLEGIAEFYSKELSQKVTRGLRESALKCNSTGGSVPTGYRLENKKFVIDEAGANIVRKVFDWYVGGMSIQAILTTLKNCGFRNSRGKPFTRTTIDRMLRNRRYIGIYTYKDISIEGGIPALVDKQTFYKVQQMLDVRPASLKPYSPYADYMLAGKLICGECQEHMQGESAHGKSGQQYFYYTCPGAKKRKNCDMHRFSRERLEIRVAQDAQELLNTPGMIDLIADIVEKETIKEAAKNDETPQIKQMLKDIEQKIDNLLDLAEKGIANESLLNRLNTLEQEKKDAQLRLEAAEVKKFIIDKERVIWWLSQFANGDVSDPDYRRRIINMLVTKVTVYHDPDAPNAPNRFKLVYQYTINRTTGIDTPSPSGEGVSVRIDDRLVHQKRLARKIFPHASRFLFSRSKQPSPPCFAATGMVAISQS